MSFTLNDIQALHPMLQVGGILFVSIMFYYVIIFIKDLWKLRDFRGPLALPMIGICYSPQIASLLRYISVLRKQYGKIFKIFLFSKSYIVLLDPGIVRRVMADAKTFVKGTDYTVTFAVAFGKGLVTSNGDQHKADRSIFNKYFIRQKIVTKMSLINKITVNAIDQMVVGEMGDAKSQAFDLEKFFSRLSLRVFMNFALGYDYSGDIVKEKRICKDVSDKSCTIGWMLIMSLPNWSWLPWIKSIKSLRAEIRDDLVEQVDIRKKQMELGTYEGDTDCLTGIIENNMTLEEVGDHAFTMVGAGHDTTSFFSSYLCLLLAQHPEVQEALRKVIFDHLGDKEEVTADDIAEMKYLHKVMQETLRLYAIIPSVTRYCVKETTFKEASVDGKDVTIPKDTNLYIPMFLMNRDPSVYTEPAKFNPDRFEKGDYTNARTGFLPFGYGVRTCIGNTLAQLEVAVFICHLLRRVSIEEEPGFKVNIAAGISLTTSNGVRVIFKNLN